MSESENSRFMTLLMSEIRLNQSLIEEIEELKKEKQILIQKLKETGKDNLTGLYNRNIVEEAYLKTNTVIMCDIDDFKLLNDNYGHNFGDIILKMISKILVDNVRDSDYVIRWGGEEFVLLINHPNVKVAEKMAERIRNEVESLEGDMLEDGTICPRITMSFGVARLHKSSSIIDDIREVDEALYESKKNGKNNVTVLSEQQCNLGYVKKIKMHK